MDAPQVQGAQLEFDETLLPRTVFANHVEVVGVDDYTTVTFYSVVFPRAADAQCTPPKLKARPVAQVTLPGGKWQELMENIRQTDEAARQAREGGAEDGRS